MRPDLKNDEFAETWHYAWQRTPTLRERIWDFLSSGAVFLVLGIASIVMLALALILGVELVR
jgi:hypothetical protein